MVNTLEPIDGEALFGTMAELCEDPEAARKFRVLQQLERETKELLLPATREVGNSGDESPERIEDGEKLGATLANAPWSGLMTGFQTELERFVLEFEQAENLAPSGKEKLLRHVTAHERALLSFAKRELEPNGSDPLQAILDLLQEAPAL